MKRTQRKILAQIDSVSTSPWLAGGELQSELRRDAASRLGVLGMLTACTFLLFFALRIPAGVSTKSPVLFHSCCVCGAVVLSLLLFGLSRTLRSRPRLLLDLGVAYQLAMGLIIGILFHHMGQPTASITRGWSDVAVWIIVFAVVVPSTPRRTLWVSSLTAAMDPLALAIAVALGRSLPSSTVLPQLFGPTLVAVFTAVVSARISQRIGKRIDHAQELGSSRERSLVGSLPC